MVSVDYGKGSKLGFIVYHNHSKLRFDDPTKLEICNMAMNNVFSGERVLALADLILDENIYDINSKQSQQYLNAQIFELLLVKQCNICINGIVCVLVLTLNIGLCILILTLRGEIIGTEMLLIYLYLCQCILETTKVELQASQMELKSEEEFALVQIIYVPINPSLGDYKLCYKKLTIDKLLKIYYINNLNKRLEFTIITNIVKPIVLPQMGMKYETKHIKNSIKTYAWDNLYLLIKENNYLVIKSSKSAKIK